MVQTLQERQVELAKKLAGFSQTSLEDAANLRAWKAAYGTETGFSEASSIPGRKSHLTAVGHVTGKPKDINGVEQAVKTEANPKPGTISGVGTAPVQATDDRDAPVDELKKPASTRDMGIGTGSKTLEPIRNPSVSEQVGVHSTYAHAFHAPGVALTNAVEPEKRGLPEAGAAVATNPEPPRQPWQLLLKSHMNLRAWGSSAWPLSLFRRPLTSRCTRKLRSLARRDARSRSSLAFGKSPISSRSSLARTTSSLTTRRAALWKPLSRSWA